VPLRSPFVGVKTLSHDRRNRATIEKIGAFPSPVDRSSARHM